MSKPMRILLAVGLLAGFVATPWRVSAQNAKELQELNRKISRMVDAHATEMNIKNKLIAELYAEIEKLKSKNAPIKPQALQLEKALGGVKSNPPAAPVKGVITKVSAEGLVLIDRGATHGLQVGHTLEVFRTQPMAKYLGMIQVLEVAQQKSVGRLIGPAKNAGIQAGDQVSGKVMAEK